MYMGKKYCFLVFVSVLLFYSCSVGLNNEVNQKVDYVNPYMGNISHLLVPTYPTVHLPNSMLRLYPERTDFTSEVINGLPLLVTTHRGQFAFNLSPIQGKIEGVREVMEYTYDREKILPYSYQTVLDEKETMVEYAVSHQSAICKIGFTQNEDAFLALNSHQGEMKMQDNTIAGHQIIGNNTKVYLYLETDKVPFQCGKIFQGKYIADVKEAEGDNACLLLSYGKAPFTLQVRYGISFISTEQAKKNLYREQADSFNYDKIYNDGRNIWNEALNKIEVEGTDNDKALFYTSLYRCYERPVCISEDGQYYSAFDGQVHKDDGTPFYTDDWIWDTYRATHPLRLLIDHKRETDIINSYLRMAKQRGNDWLPTFPQVTGDAHCMNSNHAVATILDAHRKGITDFDLDYAYVAAKKAIEEKTLAPWSEKPAGELDHFYKEHGYIPALQIGEEETIPEVHSFEKRQPIAVTLGTAYDQWCLSEIARTLGKEDEAEHYLTCSYNYRNVYNPTTQFFHPKDKDGKFIEPFDYSFPGGMGAREFYDENNGWVYRWDVPHNIPDLISLMGGDENFDKNLDQMYRTPLGRSKYAFYAKLPDHTGNVGQFSMANEPSLHIPYLYNYCKKPWKTQKRVRILIEQWFRNDLMGVPGDEDGGGMSAFVDFTMLGLYPVTPGLPVYSIGSPFFPYAKINLSNGNVFEIVAKGCSKENKYIQSATLNGKVLDTPFMTHEDIIRGGKLEFVMGSAPNRNWGIREPEVNIAAKQMDFK